MNCVILSVSSLNASTKSNDTFETFTTRNNAVNFVVKFYALPICCKFTAGIF